MNTIDEYNVSNVSTLFVGFIDISMVVLVSPTCIKHVYTVWYEGELVQVTISHEEGIPIHNSSP